MSTAASAQASQSSTAHFSNIPLPSKLELKGDVAANWDFFKEEWNDYEVASDLDKQPEAKRVATFKVSLGREARQVLTNLKLQPDKLASLKGIIAALDVCFKPKVNIIYERFVFGTAFQEENEKIDAYVSRLRTLAATCGYKELESEMIRDRLVIGIKSEDTKKQLISDSLLTLKTAIDTCKANELADAQMASMKAKTESAVNKVASRPSTSSRGRISSRLVTCKYCGTTHKQGPKLCPAYGKRCAQCSKMNHFKSVCESGSGELSKRRSGPGRSNRRPYNVRQLEEGSQYSDGSSEFSEEEAFCVQHVDWVNNGNAPRRTWTCDIVFDVDGEGRRQPCQLDSGATINVMEKATLTSLFGSLPALAPSTSTLVCFNNGSMQPIGEITLGAHRHGRVVQLKFQVVQNSRKKRLPLLSAAACEALDLVKLSSDVYAIDSIGNAQDIVDEYSDVFRGIGLLEGECKLHVDPAVKPVKQPPRRVPVPLRKELKAKLDELLEKKIIAKENGPTEWTSNLVIVKTPNKLRLCIDPFHLNKALRRSEFETPTFESITPELTKARFFSVMDTKDGFWNVKLDGQSSQLTTFWTPFGRFRWERLPFGLKVSGDEYQRRLHEIFGDIKNIVIVQDDILVLGVGGDDGEASKAHDKALRELLARARGANVKFNQQKVKLKLREVKYMGHIITNHGIKADPDKVRAIVDMQYPTDTKEVKSFLGLVTYLSKFVPNLSAIADPLRSLLHKNKRWSWAKEQEDAVDNIKQLISNAPVLAYFDPEKLVTLQADASSKGLGCVLLQEGHPVAFASRSLSDSEKNWANIERECLAIVFACERFSHYLVGGKGIVVQTDHKPLEAIFQKPLLQAPVDGIYRELESIQTADNVNIQQASLARIKAESATDECLCQLATVIKSGWPAEKERLPFSLHPFWEQRDALAIQDGVIFRGDQVVVPRTLRPDMMKKVHRCHLGMVASIRRAREALYWPFMTSEIKEKIRSCRVCQELAPEQGKPPMKSHAIPELPWERAAIDTFQYKGQNYAVLVDAYSDFFEIKKMSNITAERLIKFCKRNFARYGIPQVLVSDNAPQFVGSEFCRFAREWEFLHSTSSPFYSRANGKAEAAVKIVKTLMKKCDADQSDFYLALLEWRNVPTSDIDASPAQRLMSRRTRTTLPIAKKLLVPRTIQGVRDAIELKRRKTKLHHDRKAKALPELEIGDEVLVKPPQGKGKWELGDITGKHNSSSFDVTIDGRAFRRNRTWIRPFWRPVAEAPREEDRRISIRPSGESSPAPTSTPQKRGGEQTEAAKTKTSPALNQLAQPLPQREGAQTRSGREVKKPKRFTFSEEQKD
ncbi:Reverse transcriptase (RNA-dependent DNA polymerase) [Nesidiocoris tenuis]|uniref:RNA-directed DNA polymerase n=1 Tax=Nesidiocoris tenuis TaxID=355587 RepID=A0ABN7AFF1_9HEMI|nr:Reverse transcriptase (RNA-dependent DNA polymerase) [Nesidiocoris tenuis]